VAQIFRPQVDLDADLVTVTIGAKDTNTIQDDPNRGLAFCWESAGDEDCKRLRGRRTEAQSRRIREEFMRRKNDLIKLLPDALEALRHRISRQTTVVITGYPQLVGPSRQNGQCLDRELAFPTRNTDDDLNWTRRSIASLNSALEDAAEREGFFFLDLAAIFADHELCASEPWEAGRTHTGVPLDTDEVFSSIFAGQGSYLPNARGHAEIARGLERLLEREGARHTKNPAGLPMNNAPK
jgi:hypothetical protein